MKIIPVIDLKDGKVVAARGGDRRAYAPLESPLASGSSPEAVVGGLLEATGFREIYVADLNAIEGKGGHAECIAGLLQAFPDVAIWLDAGVRCRADLTKDLLQDRVTLVVGSESLLGGKALEEISDAVSGFYILSLDFHDAEFVGAAEVLANYEHWPQRLIVMSLSRVGDASGPDLKMINQVTRVKGARDLYAAGGVRNEDDLAALSRIGVSGALVSTALHSGTLKFKPS